MKSLVVKRSIVIDGHKTSISLEQDFWTGLKEIARSRGLSPSDLVSMIDVGRRSGNLSSTVRLFVLDHYRSRIVPPVYAPLAQREPVGGLHRPAV
jgi:predicted DNA-binding ribbon-helix-helix protein